MELITRSFLTLAALIRGRFLSERSRPDQGTLSPGWRGRFVLATLLCAAWWNLHSQDQVIHCYKPLTPSREKEMASSLMKTIKAAWRALDSDKGEEFRARIQEAIGWNLLDGRTGKLLQVAYNELSYHKIRTRGEGKGTTCYRMTPLGGDLQASRERALVQLELLAKARSEGKIDQATSKRAVEVIARELEIMDADSPTRKEGKKEILSSAAVTPRPESLKAAEIIVEWEGGTPPFGK
jgi:hypothetical protein